jgi:hypothetical protein
MLENGHASLCQVSLAISSPLLGLSTSLLDKMFQGLPIFQYATT